jgi:hypothetical protein
MIFWLLQIKECILSLATIDKITFRSCIIVVIELESISTLSNSFHYLMLWTVSQIIIRCWTISLLTEYGKYHRYKGLNLVLSQQVLNGSIIYTCKGDKWLVIPGMIQPMKSDWSVLQPRGTTMPGLMFMVDYECSSEQKCERSEILEYYTGGDKLPYV